MSTVAWGLTAALLTLAAVAAYLRVARERGWVDVPNQRSSHARATPSSGGIGIIAALLAVLLVLAGLARDLGFDARQLLALPLLCTALICIIGAWDDRRALPVTLRLSLFLAMAVVLAVHVLAPQDGPQWMLTLVLALALAWLVNLYNFMDGIDGIAALQTVLTAGAIAVFAAIAGAPALYSGTAAAIAGAYLGFLVFNWPPARLFMGDAGSLSAGLLLGWLGLWGWQAGWLPAAAWLLLLSPFLVDTGWTLLVRILRRAPLAQAHREHLYQRLARHWGSHRRVDLALLVLHLVWLQPLALLSVLIPHHAQTFLAIGLFPQLVLIVRTRGLQ